MVGTNSRSTGPMKNPTRKTFRSYFNYRWQNMQNIVPSGLLFNKMPKSWQTYYNTFIKQWSEWAKGFVPQLHKGDFFTIGIGKTVCDILARECISGKFRFDGDGSDFVSRWAKDNNLDEKVAEGFWQAIAVGNCIPRLNVVAGTTDIYPTMHSIESTFFEVNRKGEVIRARFYDCLSGSSLGEKSYFTVEDRVMFNGLPFYKVQLYRNDGTITVPSWNTTQSIEQIKDILLKSQFGDCYGNIELNKWYKLPFKTLGCYNWMNSKNKIGTLRGYGESSLHTALDILYSIDYNYTMQQMDMYWGRTRVILPKETAPKVKPVIKSGFDKQEIVEYFEESLPLEDDIFIQTPGNGTITDKPPQPIIMQPDLRGEVHRYIRDADLELLASKVGLSSTDLANHLTYNNSTKTATQVNEEASTTAVTISEKRDLADSALNALISDVADFYGIKGKVSLVWNQDPMTNRADILEEFSRGLRSREDTISALDGSLSAQQVKVRAEKAQADHQQPSYDTAGDVFGLGDEY